MKVEKVKIFITEVKYFFTSVIMLLISMYKRKS